MQSVGIYQEQISLKFETVPTCATIFRSNSETGTISHPAIFINANILDLCLENRGEKTIKHMIQHECAHAALGHGIEEIICKKNLNIEEEFHENSNWYKSTLDIREIVADNYFAIENEEIAKYNVEHFLSLFGGAKDQFSLMRCAHAIRLFELVWQQDAKELFNEKENANLWHELIDIVKNADVVKNFSFPLITLDNKI